MSAYESLFDKPCAMFQTESEKGFYLKLLENS